MQAPEKIPFDQFIAQLLDADKPLPANYFYRLSDLEPDEQQLLLEVWSKVPLWRRQAIMEDIVDLSAEDLVLSFVSCARVALQDSDPGIRRLAVQSLWEYEEDDLIPVFVQLVEADEDHAVRSVAAGALGSFIYRGEIEELDAGIYKRIEDLLIKTAQGEDSTDVRCSALESLGFSSHPEVSELIKTAFGSKEKEWKASALYAMGRSGDIRWRKQVLSMLEHTIPIIRMEAARAAGELELKEATESLIELLDDPNEDIRLASIWSLSQLSGEGIRELLEEALEQAEDDTMLEFIEAALDNLEFNESLDLLPLLEIDEDYDGEDLDLFQGFEDLDEDQDD